MSIVRKENFLVNNSWLIGDLKCARDCIDAIILDLLQNNSTHVDYVFEKLDNARCVLENICSICKRKDNEDERS